MRKYYRLVFIFFIGWIVCIQCVTEDEFHRQPRPPQPSPIQILANSLTEGGLRMRGKKIIVMTFYDRDDPRSEDRLGELIAEKLTTELVKKGQFKVLDRGIYGKILESKGLSLKGDVDMKTMKKIAQILELDGIITGIIYQYGEGLFVNARLLEIETGLILKAEEVFVLLTR